MNIEKMFKNNKMDFNKNILHNKYLLYVIFFISMGNFFIELMKGDMYFVAIYILIGVLTTFFNKNMIVVLSLAAIFANILKYGRASTYEGFNDNAEEGEEHDLEKALGADTSHDGEIIDEIVEGKESKKKHKKEKKHHLNEVDSDDDESVQEKEENKKKKKKEGLKQYSDQDLDAMDYEKTEKLLKNQNQILKNMKEYKPFLDTIQGLAKNISGFVKEDSE
jgi:hypothetical protein